MAAVSVWAHTPPASPANPSANRVLHQGQPAGAMRLWRRCTGLAVLRQEQAKVDVGHSGWPPHVVFV